MDSCALALSSLGGWVLMDQPTVFAFIGKGTAVGQGRGGGIHAPQREET